MNKICLVGNLCKDVEATYTQGEKATAIVRNTIAVQRKFKNSEGKYDSDFIPITAFGTSAEFLAKYFIKGSKVGITGRIQTGSYVNKEGNKVYTTDVIVEEVEFVTKKDENPASNGLPSTDQANANNFVNVPSGADNEDSLPFR